MRLLWQNSKVYSPIIHQHIESFYLIPEYEIIYYVSKMSNHCYAATKSIHKQPTHTQYKTFCYRLMLKIDLCFTLQQ